jgi:hypothetical protein
MVGCPLIIQTIKQHYEEKYFSHCPCCLLFDDGNIVQEKGKSGRIENR